MIFKLLPVTAWQFLFIMGLTLSCTNRDRSITVYAPNPGEEPQYPCFNIPVVDLSTDTSRQVIVDREPGQYLGHPTTLLLEDNRTILCVYPKGHGRGPIVYKRSTDAGRTWSNRLPVPESWETSLEVPTLYRVTDSKGIKRVIMFSGLYPGRMAVSEDDGITWSELIEVGDWGGIVFTGALIPLKTGAGHYMTFFHDDMRFFTRDGEDKYRADREINPDPLFTLYSATSKDGGLTWERPRVIFESREMHLCEPGVIRSPDGNRIAMFLRENSRRTNSQIIFSDDEGNNWSSPEPLPNALTGDRHVPVYTPDGRMVVVFRDHSPRSYYDNIVNISHESGETDYSKIAESIGRGSPTEGDWVAWVGTWDDIVNGGEGQYRIRIMDNKQDWDTSYPGVEVLPDGTIVTTTYGHWVKGEEPFIVCARFRLDETDQLAGKRGSK